MRILSVCCAIVIDYPSDDPLQNLADGRVEFLF
jgi:hypothetical protein